MTHFNFFKDFNIGPCSKNARVAVLKNNHNNGELLCPTVELLV